MGYVQSMMIVIVMTVVILIRRIYVRIDGDHTNDYNRQKFNTLNFAL